MSLTMNDFARAGFRARRTRTRARRGLGAPARAPDRSVKVAITRRVDEIEQANRAGRATSRDALAVRSLVAGQQGWTDTGWAIGGGAFDASASLLRRVSAVYEDALIREGRFAKKTGTEKKSVFRLTAEALPGATREVAAERVEQAKRAAGAAKDALERVLKDARDTANKTATTAGIVLGLAALGVAVVFVGPYVLPLLGASRALARKE